LLGRDWCFLRTVGRFAVALPGAARRLPHVSLHPLYSVDQLTMLSLMLLGEYLNCRLIRWIKFITSTMTVFIETYALGYVPDQAKAFACESPQDDAIKVDGFGCTQPCKLCACYLLRAVLPSRYSPTR
jgi:hypothetical protein